MKSVAAFVLTGFLAVVPAAAQHGGSHSGGGGLHSGGGSHHGGGGFHGGGSVSGHGGYAGHSGYLRRPTVVAPVAPSFGFGYYGYGGYPTVPYYGSPDDSGYANGYAPAPPQESMEYSNAQPLPPPENPQPDNSQLQIYSAPAPRPEDSAMSEGRYYLIAYKDHSVYTALAYWMENGVLNYVTSQNVRNQVSLDLLDLELTKQLNARHGYSFNIAK